MTRLNSQQTQCKKILDDLNKRQNGIPEHRISEYENCLIKIEDYYNQKQVKEELAKLIDLL